MVKTPSWVKKAPLFRDAWEETGGISSIEDVAVITPSSLISSKGNKAARSKPLNVKNFTENNTLRYTRHVSEYSFKSPFPIHKLARKSSSDSTIDSQTRFRPVLVCGCPLTAQVLHDPQCLPRVIVKDSANFAKFRRDVKDCEPSVVSKGSFSTSSTTKARLTTGSLRPPNRAASTEKSRNSTSNPRQFSEPSKLVLTGKTNRQLKSDRSLFSMAILEDTEGPVDILERPQCILNDNYVVKRIIYTLEDNLDNMSSRNHPPKPRITPGIGG